MMFFSDITGASPQGIKDVLLVLSTLLGLAGGVLALVRKPQVLPQPLHTQEAEKWATARGVEALAATVSALQSGVHEVKVEMSGLRSEYRDHVDEKVTAIHTRLDPVIRGLEHMLGEWDQFKKREARK